MMMEATGTAIQERVMMTIMVMAMTVMMMAMMMMMVMVVVAEMGKGRGACDGVEVRSECAEMHSSSPQTLKLEPQGMEEEVWASECPPDVRAAASEPLLSSSPRIPVFQDQPPRLAAPPVEVWTPEGDGGHR